MSLYQMEKKQSVKATSVLEQYNQNQNASVRMIQPNK